MPTGYTAPVVDGNVVQAREFLLTCARAFGEFVHQRDESITVRPEVPDAHERVKYELERLGRSKADLEALKTWSQNRIVREHAEYVREVEARNARYQRDYDATKARLEHMIAQVESWEPNEQAAPIKRYALEQLAETMRFDCGSGPYHDEPEHDAQKWYQEKLAWAEQDVERSQGWYEERLQRALDTQAYAAAVLDSINQVPLVKNIPAEIF